MGNTNPTNPLATFQFNTKTVRVVTIEGNPWFVAADVCRVLGLSNPTKALYAVGPDEKKTITLTLGKGGSSRALISESGLYKLVMRSDKPEAKPFQDWVCKVVLPAIRKDGAPAFPQSSLPFPTTTTAAPSNLPVSTAPVLHVKDGRVFANSRHVAATFGKEHRNVLRDISDRLLKSEQTPTGWFNEVWVVRDTPTGGKVHDKTYDMTRDGFVLLVMGYGGPLPRRRLSTSSPPWRTSGRRA